MIIATEHLGNIEYSENDILSFAHGIPGFEEEKQFILIPAEDIEFPFSYLQSIQSADLAFIVTDPFLFVENYDFELSSSDATALNVKNDEDLADISVLTIVTIPNDVDQTTINIMAPIVINHAAKVGRQVLLSEYSDTKFPLFRKIEG
ncbi:MAG: flagellar assembly protein FliW [Firmicutes bacterium]|nr:flagellar assembly protein FliW [Bacillota bacterium]